MTITIPTEKIKPHRLCPPHPGTGAILEVSSLLCGSPNRDNFATPFSFFSMSSSSSGTLTLAAALTTPLLEHIFNGAFSISSSSLFSALLLHQIAIPMKLDANNKQAPLQSCTVKYVLYVLIRRPAIMGPARAAGAASVNIIPVHCPRRDWRSGSGPRMNATEAGGRPITAPEQMPKRITKARAVLTVWVRVQRRRIRSDEAKVTMQWTLRAPKLRVGGLD
jgi:hypothetical protein